MWQASLALWLLTKPRLTSRNTLAPLAGTTSQTVWVTRESVVPLAPWVVQLNSMPRVGKSLVFLTVEVWRLPRG